METVDGLSNWTVGAVEKSIADAGMTFKSWYEEYGKIEGFATGGITPANKPFWVGEHGPELMMRPQQYGVLSNPDSLNMLSRVSAASYADDYATPYAKGFGRSCMATSPASLNMLTRMPGAASDGGATAALHSVISEMKDEMKVLRHENKVLMTKIAKNTKDNVDEFTGIRTEGMPTREHKPTPMHIITFPA